MGCQCVPVPFRSWLFRKRAKPGSSRDPFGTERMAARRTLRFRPAVQMGSSTGESGLVDGKVVVVMAARRAWEASPLFFSTSSRWYQEVCEVLFRLFPNCVFAFSRPLTILRGFRWFFLRFAAALALRSAMLLTGVFLKGYEPNAKVVSRLRCPWPCPTALGAGSLLGTSELVHGGSPPATNAVIGPQIRSAAGGASPVIRRRTPTLKSENAARIITP